MSFDPKARARVRAAFTDFNAIPEAWLAQLISYIEANPPLLPASQISGIQILGPKAAPPIIAAQSTTSSTFGNLTTTGPTLSGLPDGVYQILFGLAATSGANDITKRAIAGPKVNSTNPTSPDDCVLITTVATTIPYYGAKMVEKTLTGGSNTITIVYKSEDNVATATFGERWLIVFRQGSA